MPKVDLFLFSYRSVSTVPFMALTRMVRHTNAAGIAVEVFPYGNALIHRSRNTAIGHMHADATHVLFCDDDMLPGREALVNMMALDAPVVSALCTTRQPPIRIAANIWDEDSQQFVQFSAINLTRPVSGPFAPGTGFLLLRRDAVEQVIEYHLTAQDWLAESRREMDRLKVRAEHREEERKRKETIRRINWEREKFLRVFDYPVIDNEMQLGEDIAFGRKLLNLKIPVLIDTGTWVGHLGEYAYSVTDILDAEKKAQETLRP